MGNYISKYIYAFKCLTFLYNENIQIQSSRMFNRETCLIWRHIVHQNYLYSLFCAENPRTLYFFQDLHKGCKFYEIYTVFIL